MQTLNPKERRILTTITKLGDASVSDIARETLINRTALYHTLNKLSRAGLVTACEGERGSHYRAISVEDFDHWAETKLTQMSQTITSLREDIVQATASTPSLRSDVRYFEGLEAIKDIYADTWRDNEQKQICAITDYAKAYETLGDYVTKEYFPDRIAHGVRVRNLLPKSPEGERDFKKQGEMLREMRFIDLFKDLGIEINVYSNKVAIVAYDKIKPSGIIIKNDIIANAFQNIFEYLWKSAGKIDLPVKK